MRGPERLPIPEEHARTLLSLGHHVRVALEQLADGHADWTHWARGGARLAGEAADGAADRIQRDALRRLALVLAGLSGAPSNPGRFFLARWGRGEASVTVPRAAERRPV